VNFYTANKERKEYKIDKKYFYHHLLEWFNTLHGWVLWGLWFRTELGKIAEKAAYRSVFLTIPSLQFMLTESRKSVKSKLAGTLLMRWVAGVESRTYQLQGSDRCKNVERK